MFARIVGMCRGDGLGYCAFTLPRSFQANALTARCSLDDSTILVPVFSMENNVRGWSGKRRLFVIAIPLVKAASPWRIEIFASDMLNKNNPSPVAEYFIPLYLLKWRSRIDYRLRPVLMSRMLGIERDHEFKYITIESHGVFPYSSQEIVFRATIKIPEQLKNIAWRWQAYLGGHPGNAIDTILLEDSLINHRVDQTNVRHITISGRVPKANPGIVLSVQSDNPSAPGFAWGLLPEEQDAKLHGFYELTLDAKADPTYHAWFLKHRVSPTDLEEQRATLLSSEPLISIIIPIFEPPIAYLRDSIESVKAQSYQNWNLILVNASPNIKEVNNYLTNLNDTRIAIISLSENLGIAGNTNTGIERARGDYIAFLDQDDMLEPDALFEYAQAINDYPTADLLYCDEDSFNDDCLQGYAPLLKPDFNEDLLFSHNYICHLLMVSRHALDQVELSPDSVNGAQDFDLTLKVTEVARSIVHVPRVLYHWRQHSNSSNNGNLEAKPYAREAGRQALDNHFKRQHIKAIVEPTEVPYVYRTLFLPPADIPLVSIIIPNKDHTNYLKPCIESIFEKAGYNNFEIIIVENNSIKETTFDYYTYIQNKHRQVRVVQFNGRFNYSKIINYGVKQSQGDFLLLLNNDTKVLSDSFLHHMLGYFSRSNVGVLGALLYYPDGLIQHAGLALMASMRLGFMNQNHTLETNKGYLGSSSCGFNYSAVLGACQMTRRTLFDEVGGYSENLAVTYNDVDFCWRVREKGFLVTYTPYIQLYHREFGSRERDAADTERIKQTEKEAQIMQRRWPRYFTEGDPCINPNCSKDSPYFKLGN